MEEGLTRATAEEQVNAGLRRVYNQSKYLVILLSQQNGVLEIFHWNLKILMNNKIHYYDILILIKTHNVWNLSRNK